MKKYLYVVFLLATVISLSKAQKNTSDYKIGIRVGPSLSISRTAANGENTAIERDGSSVNFLLGAFVDIPFKENYFFEGGVNYATKSTRISVQDSRFLSGNAATERYDHEYLQLPVLLKLYTNEILLDTKVYFNFGLVPEIRLSTENENPGVLFVNEFQDFDVSGNFGGGIEKLVGVNTRVFVSLNYYIGFINQVKEQNPIYDELNIKSGLFSLEFGIKF